MNYAIPWDLLPEDDLDLLDRLEIERGPSFLKFKRKLNREEIVLVCERLWNFRSIVPDAEDNHINFAIGDALGEYSKQFGEDEGELFVKDWTHLSKLRDNMLRITGGALIYLQTVEYQIKGCCSMLNLRGLKLTVADFHASDPKRRRQTLGQLKNALIENFSFADEFEVQFGRFVDDRNEFVHTLWTGEMDMDERTGLPSEDNFRNKLELTISLIRQAREIELVFRGLLGFIVDSLPETLKDNDVVIRWKKYIARFKATLRETKA